MPDLSTFLRQSSLTFSDCQTDCFNYINSLPEGSKPKDLFKGSEGRLIIDYLCAFHSDIAYKIIMGFCENYLIYANKIENIIANAESKGYNVSRGNNGRFLCTFTPDQTTTIHLLEQVGSIEDYGIYSLESKKLEAGVDTTLQVVMGTKNSLTYTVDDINQLAYRFTANNISDDIVVYLNNDPINGYVPVSTDPIQALFGNLVAMTNSYGSVDLLDFSNLSSMITEEVTVYEGSYHLIENQQFFTYRLGNGDLVYSLGAIQLNSDLYTEASTSSVKYGKVINIDVDVYTITISGNNDYVGTYQPFINYYEYSMGDRSYYMQSPIGIGLNVYEDPDFQTLFGEISSLSISESTCTVTAIKPRSDRTYIINSGTLINLDYIVLEQIQWSGSTGIFNIGSLSNIVQLSAGSQPEDASTIQRNAILHEQTRNTIVARRDAKKLVRLQRKILPGILNTNDYDYSPARVAVTYVLNSGLPATDTQLEQLDSYLSECRALGIPMPFIVNSFELISNIEVPITTSQIVSKEYLQSQTETIFSKYCNDPGISINFDEIEQKIEKINSVQVSRFVPVGSDYTVGSYLPLGSFIINGSNAFLAASYNYHTGNSEPSWPTTENSQVIDGDLILTPVKQQYANSWQEGTALYIGQIINPTTPNGHSYEVIGVVNKTGNEEPLAPGNDGDIIWKQTYYDATAPMWTANTQTNYGDIVNITSSNNSYSLVAANFRRIVDPTEPDWNNYTTSTVVNTSTIKFVRVPLSVSYDKDGNSVNTIAKGTVLQLPWNSYLTAQIKVV